MYDMNMFEMYEMHLYEIYEMNTQHGTRSVLRDCTLFSPQRYTTPSRGIKRIKDQCLTRVRKRLLKDTPSAFGFWFKCGILIRDRTSVKRQKVTQCCSYDKPESRLRLTVGTMKKNITFLLIRIREYISRKQVKS